jgi:hypothetical protein
MPRCARNWKLSRRIVPLLLGPAGLPRRAFPFYEWHGGAPEPTLQIYGRIYSPAGGCRRLIFRERG